MKKIYEVMHGIYKCMAHNHIDNAQRFHYIHILVAVNLISHKAHLFHDNIDVNSDPVSGMTIHRVSSHAHQLNITGCRYHYPRFFVFSGRPIAASFRIPTPN